MTDPRPPVSHTTGVRPTGVRCYLGESHNAASPCGPRRVAPPGLRLAPVPRAGPSGPRGSSDVTPDAQQTHQRSLVRTRTSSLVGSSSPLCLKTCHNP